MADAAATENSALPADEAHQEASIDETPIEFEPVDPLAQTFDAVIMGTGVIESIVAWYVVFVMRSDAVDAVYCRNTLHTMISVQCACPGRKIRLAFGQGEVVVEISNRACFKRQLGGALLSERLLRQP
jgi:hypothetical protein